MRERHDATGVAARWCVLLKDLSELFGCEALREPNERRPKPSVNQRDLAIDEPTYENLVGVDDSPKDRIDVVTLWMCPPAPLDGFANDSFCKARHSSFGRNEDDAMLPDESQRLLSGVALGHDAQWLT